MKNFSKFILLNSLLLFSCESIKYDQETCEDLSFKSFKGSPFAANSFKKNCVNIKVNYTHQKCQEALKYFIMIGNIDQVKKEFGDKIDQCFTQNDLNNFLKDSK